jgi:dolichol-phosphate mannosyltransferase
MSGNKVLDLAGNPVDWIKNIPVETPELTVNAGVGIAAVSVIMPTLNEAGNIASLIECTVAALKHAGVTAIEIIVVDDDSADLTWEVASRTVSPPARIEVIRRMEHHGLTPSLMEGINAARHDVIVWLDCDFSHPPECIPQMLYMLARGFDVVVNSRYVVGGGENRVGEGGALQRFLSQLFNWVMRFFLEPSFADYTSGFIAVRKAVLTAVPLRGDYGEYFVDFIFRVLHKKYKVCELPYQAAPRRSGHSKTGTHLLQYLRRGRNYIGTILRLRLATLFGRL